MSQQINDMRAVYYDALKAYEVTMKEYYTIVGKGTATTVAAAPVVVVPPIIGSATVSAIVAAGGPPPLAPVSAVAYDPNAPRSPRMTPMAATLSADSFPQMRRFTAMGQEFPVNGLPNDFNMSWLMHP